MTRIMFGGSSDWDEPPVLAYSAVTLHCDRCGTQATAKPEQIVDHDCDADPAWVVRDPDSVPPQESTLTADHGDDEQGPTPSGVRIYARDADGAETEITAGVQALYDLVISSMDWGSGFLTAEDALPVAHVARTCGFEEVDEVERYVEALRHSEEAQVFFQSCALAKGPGKIGGYRPGHMPEHDHVFSSVGKCMWAYCEASPSD